MTGTDTTAARRPLWHWIAVAVAASAIALAIAVAIPYWQEQPLREARRELARGNAARGLALADYFLDLYPGHGRGLELRARALAELGRAEESVTLYEQVGAASADDLHAWARGYLLQESWSRAAPLLEQVLRMQPDQPDALYELATCRTRLGLLREGLETANVFASLPGQQARGDLLLAAIHADMAAPEEAIEAYERVLALAPDAEGLQLPPEEFFIQYGTILLKQGAAKEAVRILGRCVATHPSAASRYLLGKALSQSGDEQAAEGEWLAAIELDPAGISTREALADRALSRGDAEGAAEWLAPLEALAQKRFETAYLFQRLQGLRKDEAAFALWQTRADQLRQLEKRIASLEQLMHAAPTSYWAQAVRAHKFATLGNWKQAEDMIKGLSTSGEAPIDSEKTADGTTNHDTSHDDSFVTDLREAIRTRGSLPSLDRVPLKQY